MDKKFLKTLEREKLLITSVDKDGTENGYDLELAEEISKNTSLPIIFSGEFWITKECS